MKKVRQIIIITYKTKCILQVEPVFPKIVTADFV